MYSYNWNSLVQLKRRMEETDDWASKSLTERVNGAQVLVNQKEPSSSSVLLWPTGLPAYKDLKQRPEKTEGGITRWTLYLRLLQLSSEEHSRCWCIIRTDSLCTFQTGFNKIIKYIIIVKQQMYWKSHKPTPAKKKGMFESHCEFCLAFLSWISIDYYATFLRC